MSDHTFEISFDYDEKHYRGSVNPSENMDEKGTPASFQVVLNDESFGNLSFNDCKWAVNEDRPAGIVKLVGKSIEKHYQL